MGAHRNCRMGGGGGGGASPKKAPIRTKNAPTWGIGPTIRGKK